MAQNYTPIDDLIKKLNTPPSYSSSQASEAEPAIRKQEALKKDEQHEMQEVTEHDISPEVKPYVNVRKETIDVDDELKKMGVQASHHRQHFPHYKRVVLPISDAAVLKGMHAPLLSSFRWMAEWCTFLLKKAHLHLTTIHGKVRRVLIRER